MKPARGSYSFASRKCQNRINAYQFLPQLDRLENREVPAAFAPNDLVVLRVGDTQTYTTTAPIYLEEYAPNKLAGGTTALTLVQSVNITSQALSTPGNQVITSDLGNGTGVGQLNRSFDSSLLTFGGIVADPGISKVPGSANLNRVIATVGVDPVAAGSINTTTYGQFNVGDDLRAVAMYDSTHLYTVGKGAAGTAGTRYFGGLGGSPVTGTVVNSNANTRGVTIGFDGQLYWSTAGPSAIFREDTSNRTLPTTLGTDTQIVTNSQALFNGQPSGTGSEKIDGIWLADMNSNGIVDAGDRLYYTGSEASGLNVSVYTGSAWGTPITLAKGPTQPAAGVTTPGKFVFGITGQVVSPTDCQLFVTYYDKSTINLFSKVYGYYDPNGTTASASGFTELLSLSTNPTGAATLAASSLQGYRGVSFAPINPTTVGLGASTTNPNPGDMVTFNAALTSLNGTPGGQVTFIDYNTANPTGLVLGTGTLDGTGHATIATTLPLGPNSIKAHYAGAGTIAAGDSQRLSVVVTGANVSTTNITSATPNPSTAGKIVTLVANVSGSAGTPSGTVTFLDGATVLGAADLSSGNASIGVSGLTFGSHTITANYSGDSLYKVSASGSTTVNVHGGATVIVNSSVAPSIPNQSVTFTATVTGNGVDASPVGNVSFLSDGVVFGSPAPLDGTGHATISLATLSAGSHFITARFNGDTIYGVTPSDSIIQTVKQAFTPGNLVVERVGDGVTPLTSAAGQVYLDEYTPGGTLVQSIALPKKVNGSQHILTLSGVASTEGGLTLSGDGHYLTLFGFDATLGTPGLTATLPSVTGRTVGRIDGLGNLDTSTVLYVPTDDALGNVRGAVSQDGTQFWVAGDSSATNTGYQYATFGQVGVPSKIGPDDANGRIPEIINGQLYVATQQFQGPVAKVGTGLPTSTTTVDQLPGLTTAGDPYGFLLFDHTGLGGAPDLMYIADQSLGLLKYYFDGSNWVEVGVKFDFAGGFTGLTGSINSSGVVTLFATGNKTATGSTASNLVTFTDSNPYNTNFTLGNVTELANVTSLNEGFRGVAFVPTPRPAPQTVSSLQINDGSVQRSRVTSLTLNFNSSLSLSLPATPDSAFQLTRQSDNAVVTLHAAVSGTSVTLTFTGGAVDGNPANYSLADGRYTLTILASQVNAGNFDGDGNGTEGDNYVLVGNTTSAPKLFRYFGDQNGDGAVGTNDFSNLTGGFKQAFGAPLTPLTEFFDFDGDGVISTADFLEFKKRFNTVLP
jgi:Bacterial Ig-like domain (group 3)